MTTPGDQDPGDVENEEAAAGASAESTRERDPAASMALLTEVLDPPVGPGYHSAALARSEAGLTPSSGTRTWLMLAVCLILGFTGTVAATTLRTPDPVGEENRAQLIKRIEAAQEVGDGHRAQVDALRSDILELERWAAAALGPEAEEEIYAAGVQAGAQTMTGPGVVITLSDATRLVDNAPGSEATPERVNARDLQLVTNGMWSAGAEAMSINGHRLTAMSAIRYAGEAVIVDFQALNPPYEITMIGDPERMLQMGTEGAVGVYLAELGRHFAIGSEVIRSEELIVEAGERLITRVSQVPEGSTFRQPLRWPGPTEEQR